MEQDSDATVRDEIVERFRTHVLGRQPDLSSYNARHDGAEGDWLTYQMGLSANGKNEPDFKGFEMKKSSSKITFGDWSPDVAVYHTRVRRSEMSRDEFLRVFGAVPATSRGEGAGRFSWSGKVFPKVGSVNFAGQEMLVEEQGDIVILYRHVLDTRKATAVPAKFRTGEVCLARWTAGQMKNRVESKFNVRGWFICEKAANGTYARVVFGPKIDFACFIRLVRCGLVFCDCGMHMGNPRPYMTWRAGESVWRRLAGLVAK